MANKSKTKIYFWLKLDENFYKNIVIKKTRKSPGGDTMVIIYQRLILQSLPTDGILYYEGALENLAEELSLSLDEEVEKIQMTLAFFTKFGLVQIDENDNADMLQVHALVDQETDWARYKRASRKNKIGHRLDNVQPVSNRVRVRYREKTSSIDNDTSFKNYMELFINFAKKNINKRTLTLQVFVQLSEMEKSQIIVGAENYINFYKNDRPDDESGQFSINAYEFLDNAVFKEY
ncbi:phage replisome organizer protein [Lactococcus garvieae]|uniref:Phage replisome organizer, putative, N-terminal region n=1 Tax=Lactococcus garvieae TaxID=1363 RepID=A0A1I4FE08_9LACT|nr:phage replisome organiser protein [Lactococcus garvieae]SFL15107.1 phage replisome organizer, putative, N-terminal region [Lactococcus garvieae]